MGTSFWKYGIVAIVLVATGCGGGGGGGPAPSPSTGSIFGITAPGAIVGIHCYRNGAYCSKPSTTLADADGKYIFSNITQMGDYTTYASLAGYISDGGNGCGFSSSGSRFFDCQIDIPLTPTDLPPPAVGVTILRSGSLDTDVTQSRIDDKSCADGIYDYYSCVSGARIISSGSIYEWNNAQGDAQLQYDSEHDVIYFVLIPPSGSLGNGVMCGVNSSVWANGMWYYQCSSLGITFDSGAGVITFATTPLYHSIGEYGLSWPFIGGYQGRVLASGSLTFPPF